MPQTSRSRSNEPEDEEAVVERGEAEETQRALSQAVADSSTVHWIFFIMGCAILLPWNGQFNLSRNRFEKLPNRYYVGIAIITAMPFFLSRLEQSHLRPVFASYLVASMQLCRLPTLIHATYTVKKVR